MRGYWYSKVLRSTTALRVNGGKDTGYVVRTILQITKGAKSAVGREVELHLTVAEARALATELNTRADEAEQNNDARGFRIDLQG
jgi:hypothetical protein